MLWRRTGAPNISSHETKALLAGGAHVRTTRKQMPSPVLLNQVFLSAAALIGAILFAADAVAQGQASLSVTVVDEHGQMTPARAWVEVAGKTFFQPTRPDTATVYPRDGSFSCEGQFSIEVPVGPAVIHVEKGKEFVPVDAPVQLVANQTLETTIRMNRWVDMPDQGWYSADLHVHLGQDNPRVLRQLALADDVHMVPAFTYWLRGTGETWLSNWPAGMLDGPVVVDDHHILTRNNIEIERIDHNVEPGGSVGATFLFNLRRPVSASVYGEHFPTDATLCRMALEHSPAVVFDSDKPSWAESVIGAALGTLHTIQVCHNHYHRKETLTGGWGMIGPLAPGESNFAEGDGLFHRTNQLYYRFLNCGFRLGVSGGSAIGVMPVPTGFHRVYAKIDGELTVDKMWDAIRQGRSFATTGPMLDFEADGRAIGSTLQRKSTQTGPIQIAARVRSIDGLESLQIIHNGRVVASRNLLAADVDPVLDEVLSLDLLPRRSGWVAARALFRAPDGLLRQAHTSPIYIEIDGKPIAFADDAAYMLRWIDVLEDVVERHPERFPSDAIRKRVLETYAEARKVYDDVIANDSWDRKSPE